jgi:hypothetical protein
MLNPATYVTLSTIRLLCGHPQSMSSVGTGFFFMFQKERTDPVGVPVIITNKHVVKDFSRLETTLTTVPDASKLSDANLIDGEVHHPIGINNLQQFVVRHPDPNVDLCAIVCMPFMGHIINQPGFRHVFINENWMIAPDHREILRSIEPALMVGYPSGLWDQANNLPIARDGLTASHPLVRWNGLKQFVVDIACFPGSSGSPIFSYEDGMYRTPGGLTPGTRAALLGVLWGGPTFSIEGKMVQQPIPTGAGEVPVVNTMMNLGYAVSADAILDIKPLIPFQ